ncbi:hypothetical protein DPMN_032555 [Dreissena polymorpha]|uniref:Uncharacterized protein n=1 Tax=Dreissena polymorpha TaxID=45954 RepID=A0A9D4M1Z6_DREPO|nr:hypothetical protein DPMN_032555 [Dreissena polymorpha]
MIVKKETSIPSQTQPECVECAECAQTTQGRNIPSHWILACSVCSDYAGTKHSVTLDIDMQSVHRLRRDETFRDTG